MGSVGRSGRGRAEGGGKAWHHEGNSYPLVSAQRVNWFQLSACGLFHLVVYSVLAFAPRRTLAASYAHFATPAALACARSPPRLRARIQVHWCRQQLLRFVERARLASCAFAGLHPPVVDGPDAVPAACTGAPCGHVSQRKRGGVHCRLQLPGVYARFLCERHHHQHRQELYVLRNSALWRWRALRN